MENPGTLSDLHMDEMEARGLDVELAVRHGLHSVKRGGELWLAIPYRRNGTVIKNKYRTLGKEKRFFQDAGAESLVWNEDVLLDKSLGHMPLVITEGELDALAVIQSGHLRTISVPDGAPAKEVGGATNVAKYSYLARVLELLPPNAPIVLAVDGDGPGRNLMNDLSVRLGVPRCKFITYPKTPDGIQTKDMNDVLNDLGVRAVAELINTAQWMGSAGVYSMDELPDENDREKYSICMGEDVERLVKLRRGDFWVISGIPGHGKSSFVDDMLCRMANAHGLRTCFASFEKNPKTDHRRDLRKWYIAHMREDNPTATWKRTEVVEADEFIQRSFRFAVPGYADNASLEWLLEMFAAAVVRHGCDVCVVDPWNEIEHERRQDETLTEYVGRAIKELKRFAKRFNVTVIVVAHPSKMKMQDELSLYSISDSAHWANKCDVGILVARNYEKQNVTIDFSKIRNDDIGTAGRVAGLFDGPTRHFLNLTTE